MIMLLPLINPVLLAIYSGNINTNYRNAVFWAILVGPICYLLLGMAVSSYQTSNLYPPAEVAWLNDTARTRLHDTKTVSLFFLAAFEFIAGGVVVIPNLPAGYLITAAVCLIVYIATAIAWLKKMKAERIRIDMSENEQSQYEEN